MAKQQYLKNEDLLKEIGLYHETGVISEALHLMFYTLSKNIAKNKCFRGYSYIDDMISEGYMQCLEKVDRFSTDKSNPFAYFTTIIYNVFLNFIKSEHRFQDKKWRELKLHIDELMFKHGIIVDFPDNIKERMYKE